jgi:hypothetical protein
MFEVMLTKVLFVSHRPTIRVSLSRPQYATPIMPPYPSKVLDEIENGVAPIKTMEFLNTSGLIFNCTKDLKLGRIRYMIICSHSDDKVVFPVRCINITI